MRKYYHFGRPTGDSPPPKKRRSLFTIFWIVILAFSGFTYYLSKPDAPRALLDYASENLLSEQGDIKLTFPVVCTLEKDCFVQYFPDLDPGTGLRDPFGGTITKNNHRGIDVRVATVPDLKDKFRIVAAADGVVIRASDEIKDKLIVSDRDRILAKLNRCGNRVKIAHQNGYETLYCNLLSGSLKVREGDSVKQGDVIAKMGYSGYAKWPHLHFELQKDGHWLDPVTGARPSKQPDTTAKRLFNRHVFSALEGVGVQLLAGGISDSLPFLDTMIEKGQLKNAPANASAVFGWAWYINLRKNDRIGLRLTGPDGLISSTVSHPVPHAGGHRVFTTDNIKIYAVGRYQLETSIVRDGKAINKNIRTHYLKPWLEPLDPQKKGFVEVLQTSPGDCNLSKRENFNVYSECATTGKMIKVSYNTSRSGCRKACLKRDNCMAWELRSSACTLLSNTRILYGGRGIVAVRTKQKEGLPQVTDEEIQPSAEDQKIKTYRVHRSHGNACNLVDTPRPAEYFGYAACRTNGLVFKTIVNANLEACVRACTDSVQCVSWDWKPGFCQLQSGTRSLFSGHSLVGTKKSRLVNAKIE